MAFYPLLVPSVIASGGGSSQFPPGLDEGFLTRVQLLDIASITPPENPIPGELWVDLTVGTAPALKIWNGSMWILSTLSGTGFGFLALSDTPDEYRQADYGKYLSVADNGGIEFTTTSFLGLADSPNSYQGRGRNFIRVAADESGLEFTSGDGLLTPWQNIIFTESDVLDIENMPSSFTQAAGKILAVASSEDRFELIDPPTPDAGSSTFVSLEDTPSSFVSQGGNILRVNSSESALQFATPGTLAAAAMMIGEIKQVAFAVPDTFLYTDTRSGLIYYQPKGGSIGRIGSLADTQREDLFDFFKVMWSQPYSSIEGGKGSTAEVDWANLKKLSIPDLRGRFLRGSSAAIPAGTLGGSSSITLSENQLPPHSHIAEAAPHNHGLNQQPHRHGYYAGDLDSGGREAYKALNQSIGQPNTDTASTTIDISVRDTTVAVVVKPTGRGEAIPVSPPFFSTSLLIFTGLFI